MVSVAPPRRARWPASRAATWCIELDGRAAKEFTLEEMRQAIRIDGKRNLTVVRDGKRVKLVMDLAGRLDMPAPGAAAAAARASKRS